MIRPILTAALVSMASLAAAEDGDAAKDAQCQFQADVMSAVQQARLDRVKKDDLTETLTAANPDWPDAAATVIPAVGEYVYGFKRRELKDVNLGETAKTQCLENWDEIQKLKNTVTN